MLGVQGTDLQKLTILPIWDPKLLTRAVLLVKVTQSTFLRPVVYHILHGDRSIFSRVIVPNGSEKFSIPIGPFSDMQVYGSSLTRTFFFFFFFFFKLFRGQKKHRPAPFSTYRKEKTCRFLFCLLSLNLPINLFLLTNLVMCPFFHANYNFPFRSQPAFTWPDNIRKVIPLYTRLCRKN